MVQIKIIKRNPVSKSTCLTIYSMRPRQVQSPILLWMVKRNVKGLQAREYALAIHYSGGSMRPSAVKTHPRTSPPREHQTPTCLKSNHVKNKQGKKAYNYRPSRDSHHFELSYEYRNPNREFHYNRRKHRVMSLKQQSRKKFHEVKYRQESIDPKSRLCTSLCITSH